MCYLTLLLRPVQKDVSVKIYMFVRVVTEIRFNRNLFFLISTFQTYSYAHCCLLLTAENLDFVLYLGFRVWSLSTAYTSHQNLGIEINKTKLENSIYNSTNLRHHVELHRHGDDIEADDSGDGEVKVLGSDDVVNKQPGPGVSRVVRWLVHF